MLHIAAYFFIIFVNGMQYFMTHLSLRAYEIVCICNFVVYFACTLIFALIVNTILTKILDATPSNSGSIVSSPYAE